jgi:methionine-rich copper-binding protein CopC
MPVAVSRPATAAKERRPAAGMGLRRHGLRLAAVGGMLLPVGIGMGADPAAAHTELVSSIPADGQTLNTPPDDVHLTFTEPVKGEFPQVLVVDGAGVSVTVREPRIDGEVVSQPVRVTAEGGYVVAYRIVSTDGHTVSGRFGFAYGSGSTTGAPDTSEAGSPATTSRKPSAGAVDGGEDGGLSWPSAAGGLAVAGIALALLLRRRARRQHDA